VKAHVYEAAPELKPLGKGIWVPTNAMQALERLGLAGNVAAAGCPLERIEVCTTAGSTLMDVDLRKYQAKYGHLTISIHRADLVRELVKGLPPDALHLGKRLVRFTADDAAVTALFDDGEVRGDFLIGADGIHSIVREQLFGKATLRYSGQTCYRGVAGLVLPPKLVRTCREVWGGQARMGYSAIGKGEAYWFAPVSAPANSPLLNGPALAAELTTRYAAFPAPIPDIIRNTPPEEIIRTDLYDIAPLEKWWQGRVALLGDAAHAMTPNLGQGGAQAIEDAYFLAESLAAQSRPEQAFEEYQRVRKPKADWVARTAAYLGWTAHFQWWLARWFRDLLLWLTPSWVNDGQIDRLLRLGS
jgi:2-polyprenyl-6-methoxyphenol hydroxylase-like FAD-dependent oxidoreductase